MAPYPDLTGPLRLTVKTMAAYVPLSPSTGLEQTGSEGRGFQSSKKPSSKLCRKPSRPGSSRLQNAALQVTCRIRKLSLKVSLEDAEHIPQMRSASVAGLPLCLPKAPGLWLKTCCSGIPGLKFNRDYSAVSLLIGYEK